MAKQRISYVPLENMDAKMRAEMERCQREGTPRPESSAIRAHVPACFWFSVKSTTSGTLIEDHVLDLLNFEKSTKYNEKQKAALAYAEAITWHLQTDDAFWDRLHKSFTEAELVELGCMIGLTLGQQSWLRLLNIEHHQVMPGTDASMAPGYESMDKLKMTKAQSDYWAKQKAAQTAKMA
jgi:hypothetical protein